MHLIAILFLNQIKSQALGKTFKEDNAEYELHFTQRVSCEKKIYCCKVHIVYAWLCVTKVSNVKSL